MIDIGRLLPYGVNPFLLSEQIEAALGYPAIICTHASDGVVEMATVARQDEHEFDQAEAQLIADVCRAHDPQRLSQQEAAQQAAAADVIWAAGILASVDITQPIDIKNADLVRALVIKLRSK